MKENAMAEAIEHLTCKLHELVVQKQQEFDWLKAHFQFATKHELEQIENRITEKLNTIMSKISDFATALNAFNDQMDTAVQGLTDDVKTLNDKITELQNSSGAITPEDQASLDAIQARAKVIADKLTALDALTPPPPPTP